MDLTTSDIIAICGIVIATILGLIGLLKKNKSKEYNINANQSSGWFSKSKQKQKIEINESDDR